MRNARTRILCLVAAVVAISATPGVAAAQTSWRGDLNELIGNRPFSVVVGDDGQIWYRHLPNVRRPPASNQKLLLSMAMLDRYGPARTLPTELRTAGRVRDGVLEGDLWIVGRGDPETDRTQLRALALALADRGIRRIRGDVIGATRPFRRDWWAPGWKDYFPDVYAPLPTALTFEGNETPRGVHVRDPERRAAVVLTHRLDAAGVVVRGDARMDTPRGGMHTLVRSSSEPMIDLLRAMNMRSRNFHAEVLGKFLGLDTTGVGSIAAGAHRVCAWIAARGPSFECHDGSGLSYANRATAMGIVQLLWHADAEPWGNPLRSTLPDGGEGTLEGRLASVDVAAKTGTLIDVSALSGWVWVESVGEWVPFSILSSGYNASAAKGIEDAIVRILANRAAPPS